MQEDKNIPLHHVVKTSNITLTVGLNAENVPVSIKWFAEDSPDTPEPRDCKAMLLSLFDKSHRDTLKIDLWTTDLQMIEMDRLMYHTLKGLADTYGKATQNRELSREMQAFARYFGEKTEILPKE
jgi:gliding motility-associated protein GldC